MITAEFYEKSWTIRITWHMTDRVGLDCRIIRGGRLVCTGPFELGDLEPEDIRPMLVVLAQDSAEKMDYPPSPAFVAEIWHALDKALDEFVARHNPGSEP